MAQLTDRDLDWIREALRSWRRKRPFESSLSTSILRNGGGYEDYIRVISEIRDRAKTERIEVHDAARRLVSSDD